MLHSSDLKKLDPQELEAIVRELGPQAWEELIYNWEFWARPNQLPPETNWKIWLALAGRGFGKTRMGVEWVRYKIKSGVKRIACVAPTKGDVRRVMVEGESGLLNVCWKGDKTFKGKELGFPVWSPTNNSLTWDNGAKAEFFSAEDPERLRGPQFEAAWCFVKGTTVTTPNGLKDVSEVSVGDFVVTSSGNQKVVGKSQRIKQVGTVVFSDGRHLCGTYDHPIMTQRGWVKLGELLEDDSVCAVDVLSTGEKSGALNQMDTTQLVQKDCTEGSMKTPLVIARDLTYTTSTVTNSTTSQVIYKNLPDQITSSFIMVKEGYLNLKNHLVKESSTAIVAAKRLLEKSKLKSLFANPANTKEQKKRENLLELANSVAQSLKVESQTSVLSVVSTWQQMGPQFVYNIQVETTPEYFANGILTHNCDEICAWFKMQETWDMLQFTLRLGKNPQVFISTTPKPVKLIRQLIDEQNLNSGKVVLSTGSSYENADNIDLDALKQYEGTRLGRQELYAEVLNEAAGALWNREILDKCDASEISNVLEFSETLSRIVVSVDPAITANAESDLTGIVVAGVDVNGNAYVLEDATGKFSPEQWGSVAVELYYKYKADRIVAEKNQGGDMVKHTIRTVDETVPLTMVHASRGKYARAEPVSALYERGKVFHCKDLHQLEEQMVTWEPLGSIGSPDRLDALVWAITNLLLKNRAQAPLTMSYQSRGLLN